MREGRISQALPLTRGSEVSGTVAALGAGVGAFALGDARYDATNDQFVGGYAECALVEAGRSRPSPPRSTRLERRAFPVVAVTAWQMLFEHARIELGQAVLVRGAAGSVGACATQMAMEAGASLASLGPRAPGPRTRAVRPAQSGRCSTASGWGLSPQTRPASSAASRSPVSTSARTDVRRKTVMPASRSQLTSAEKPLWLANEAARCVPPPTSAAASYSRRSRSRIAML
jgi:hypothetical protein